MRLLSLLMLAASLALRVEEHRNIWVVSTLYNLASGKVQFFKPVSAVAAAEAHH